MLSTRTTIGSIGVLANHTPLLGMLEPTELRLYRSETDIVRFAQGEGYIQVGDNKALVLVEEALAPEDLDVAELRDKLAHGDRRGRARPSRAPRPSAARCATSAAGRRSSRVAGGDAPPERRGSATARFSP